MSNFLQQLVARTLGLSPVVQPRLPSLFEPYSLAAQPGSIASTSGRQAEMIQQSPRERWQPARTVASTAEPRQPQQSGISTVEFNLHPDTAQVPSPGSTPGDDQSNDAPAHNPAPTVSLPARREELVFEDSLSAVSAVAPADTQMLVTPTLGYPTVPASTATANVDEAGLPSQYSADQERPEPATFAAPQSPVARSLIVRPALARASNRDSGNRNLVPPANSETEPTINVTIGRVDVRAVYPQPQPQPRPRSIPEPMSLDDYLKQRRGGRK